MKQLKYTYINMISIIFEAIINRILHGTKIFADKLGAAI
jgi:hypothetical protein